MLLRGLGRGDYFLVLPPVATAGWFSGLGHGPGRAIALALESQAVGAVSEPVEGTPFHSPRASLLRPFRGGGRGGDDVCDGRPRVARSRGARLPPHRYGRRLLRRAWNRPGRRPFEAAHVRATVPRLERTKAAPGGALGAALAKRAFEDGWVERAGDRARSPSRDAEKPSSGAALRLLAPVVESVDAVPRICACSRRPVFVVCPDRHGHKASRPSHRDPIPRPDRRDGPSLRAGCPS